MHESKLLRSFIPSAGFLILASLVMVTDASARPEYLGPAATAGIDISTGCAACHTGPAGDKNNVKSGFSKAFTDAGGIKGGGIAALKALISGPVKPPVVTPPVKPPVVTPPVKPPVVTPPVKPPVVTPPVKPPVVTPPVKPPVVTPPVKPPVVTPPVKPPVVTPPVKPPVVTPPVKPPVVTPPVKPPVVTPPVKPPVASLPMACDDHFKDKQDGDEDNDDESKLMLSNPGKVVVHAGQPLRLGVVAFGDERHITMGLSSLPKGARFGDIYDLYLRAQQGTMYWKVSDNASGKTLKFKFCAKAHGGGKADAHSGSRKVSVEVLPKLASTMNPDPAVAAVGISSAVYNTATQRLEVTGLISWEPTASPAERRSAKLDPVKLSDAEDAVALGTAKFGGGSNWSASIPLPVSSIPRVIDVTFLGRVGTALVKKLP